MDIECEVHYFEPDTEFLNKLKTQKTKNKKSYFNEFGLSDNEGEFTYYKNFQSFLNRKKTFPNQDKNNKILKLKKASTYVSELSIDNIDFIKIDTEGYELNVLKGFEDKLNIVKCIQFEYGGTFFDAEIKLVDVINYLKNFGFYDFYYLNGRNDLSKIENFSDHYQYCNIITENKFLT